MKKHDITISIAKARVFKSVGNWVWWDLTFFGKIYQEVTKVSGKKQVFVWSRYLFSKMHFCARQAIGQCSQPQRMGTLCYCCCWQWKGPSCNLLWLLKSVRTGGMCQNTMCLSSEQNTTRRKWTWMKIVWKEAFRGNIVDKFSVGSAVIFIFLLKRKYLLFYFYVKVFS